MHDWKPRVDDEDEWPIENDGFLACYVSLAKSTVAVFEEVKVF